MDLSPKIERIYHDTPLQHGQHKSGDDGRCAMEMAALLAGEKHSDQPVCASPLVTRFVIRVNDRMNDDERQRLKPFIPAMIGTRDGYDRERMWFLVTQAVTVFAPLALRATKEVARKTMLGEDFERKLVDAREFPAAKRLRTSNDYVEGPRAFAEKRKPNWTNT